MDNKFTKTLIAIEIELGFLRVPKEGIGFMAPESGPISLKLNEDKPVIQSTWNKRHQRIFGLTSFYKEKNAKPGDKMVIEFIGSKSGKTEFYKLDLIKIKPEEIKKEEITEEEAQEVIDLSNLSSPAKGNIIESRIAELVMLYGQGLLNVYKPVIDIEGIDLIVIKHGIFQPLFLQVKSRYILVKDKSLLVDLKEKSLKPHHTYFLVGVYFNPKTLEVHDNILFVPTEDIPKISTKVNANGETRHRLVVSLQPNSKQKLTKYLVKKTDFVNKLLEKFAEIEKYYK